MYDSDTNSMKLVLILTILNITIACSHLQRHTKSGYYDYSDGNYVAKDHFQAKKSYEYELAKQRAGLSNKKVLSEHEHHMVLRQLKLQKLEEQLTTKKQKTLYYENKPYMNTQQMLEYLNLSTDGQRKSYLLQNQIQPPSMESYSPEISELIDGNEIALGMTKEMVKQSWGEPDNIEYAGNPIYQNEKWSYKTTSPSLNGYVHENRVIFFESGRIAGWTKEH